MPKLTLTVAAAGVLAILIGVTSSRSLQSPIIERVSTAVPFPRGLAVHDGKMYVVARGRVRDAGGVSAAIDDKAGTLFVINPNIAEPADSPTISDAVRTNGMAFAEPTAPPFVLWDRTADPPEDDHKTDRPYCTLRYHDRTHSFYVCAFSGIDLADARGFSKNASDALLRYDLRTRSWHEIERHALQAGGNYPHHDPAHNPPPHGWLNGPDNCLVIGDQLYAAAKDNSLLVRYDLSALVDDPNAGCPPSEVAFDHHMFIEGQGEAELYGQSALAHHDGWLYIAYRTSSAIIRIRIDERGFPITPIIAQKVAQFEPYDPVTKKSANITDIDMDDEGRMYVVLASPARVHRFAPDPHQPYDGRTGAEEPWVHLADRLHKPKLKSENVLIHNGWAYITTGDAYNFQGGADGAIYRVKIDD
jgi:hypothetical protein